MLDTQPPSIYNGMPIEGRELMANVDRIIMISASRPSVFREAVPPQVRIGGWPQSAVDRLVITNQSLIKSLFRMFRVRVLWRSSIFLLAPVVDTNNTTNQIWKVISNQSTFRSVPLIELLKMYQQFPEFGNLLFSTFSGRGSCECVFTIKGYIFALQVQETRAPVSQIQQKFLEIVSKHEQSPNRKSTFWHTIICQ